MNITIVDNCPCSSQLAFKLCCQPYLAGVCSAPTPLALMRSRYTAYVMHNSDYLITTWYPVKTDLQWQQQLEQSFIGMQWLNLTIIDTIVNEHNTVGFVEFIAKYHNAITNKITTLYERSRFQLINQRWYYLDGETPIKGRNEPCPCGSEKKYKKCCLN